MREKQDSAGSQHLASSVFSLSQAGLLTQHAWGPAVPEGMLLLCHLIPKWNLAKLNRPCLPGLRGAASCTSTGTNSPKCSTQIKREFGNMFHRVEAFRGIPARGPPATELPRKWSVKAWCRIYSKGPGGGDRNSLWRHPEGGGPHSAILEVFPQKKKTHKR